MAIKKGFDHFFCDNCGTHVAHSGVGRPPAFCVVCMGEPGGAHLNDNTLKFLGEKIISLSEHSKKGDEAHTTANELKLKLAVLFLEKITAWEENTQVLPDGPSKNATCKDLLAQLDKWAREIHPILIHEKPEV